MFPVTITPLTNGVLQQATITPGEIHYYTFDIPAGYYPHVTFTGPTGTGTSLKFYLRRGSMADETNYDSMASTENTASGDIAACGADTSEATGYLTVVADAGATGPYTVTAGAYRMLSVR